MYSVNNNSFIMNITILKLSWMKMLSTVGNALLAHVRNRGFKGYIFIYNVLMYIIKYLVVKL